MRSWKTSQLSKSKLADMAYSAGRPVVNHTGCIYIGIDPGGSGGIAMIRADGSLISAVTMPETPADLLEAVKAWGAFGLHARAGLGRGWGSPGGGDVGAVKFGENYGRGPEGV